MFSLLGQMIILKTSLNVFKLFELFNILTSDRKLLKDSQKLLCASGADILLYCYHFGLVLEVVKGTQQPSGPYISITFVAFFLTDGVQK